MMMWSVGSRYPHLMLPAVTQTQAKCKTSEKTIRKDEEGKRSVSFTCKTIPVSGLCHCCSSRAHVLNFIITNLATCRHTEVDICLISCNLDKLNYQKYKKKRKQILFVVLQNVIQCSVSQTFPPAETTRFWLQPELKAAAVSPTSAVSSKKLITLTSLFCGTTFSY